MPLATSPTCAPASSRPAFPVQKTLVGFNVKLSSVPQKTFDYLASLEWLGGHENPCLLEPAGTDKSILLVGLGHAAVEVGYRVRYLTAAELVETLYRDLADNSVGRVIDNLLRVDFVVVDEIGCAPRGADVPRGMRGPPPTVAAVGRS